MRSRKYVWLLTSVLACGLIAGCTPPKNYEVIQQAKLAAKANLDAFVCSAHEVPYIKPIFKKEIITPGIRLNTKFNDQKRVTTPNDAFKKGSSWLVIGRSLTKGNIKNNIKRLINHLNQ